MDDEQYSTKELRHQFVGNLLDFLGRKKMPDQPPVVPAEEAQPANDHVADAPAATTETVATRESPLLVEWRHAMLSIGRGQG